jgi:urea transport system substrate-binding protein
MSDPQANSATDSRSPADPPPEGGDAAPPPDPRLGRRLGKYTIVGVLGCGGMGVVYEAVDTVLDRRVAVKLLPEATASDAEALRRFLAEAKAAARLNHPNTVQIFEVDRRGGDHYIVMELVRGGSAADFVKARGRFNWPEAVRVIADACRGLQAAHDAGLVHRDIKPANIMRAADGEVKPADFGLAKGVGGSAGGQTTAGAIVGTPHYMSPEQCESRPLDARSDVYSLGATFFHLLTGRPPFDADQPLQILFAHCSRPAPDPAEIAPEVPAACSAIVRRAMAKDPADRYPTAGAMLADLEAAASGAAVADPQWLEFQRALAAQLSPVTRTIAMRTRAVRRPASASPQIRPAWWVGGGVGARAAGRSAAGRSTGRRG